jgi:hypothetical protein
MGGLAVGLMRFIQAGPFQGLVGAGAGALAGGLGSALGPFLGLWLGSWLKSSVEVLEVLKRYLAVMWVPLGGFLLGYLTIVYVFAGLHGTVWRLEPQNSFKNLPEVPSFMDFIYYSVVTAATLGYGDITPLSTLARVLASTEVILGLGWLTVVFGAVIAHLQPEFKRIGEQLAKEHRSAPAPDVAEIRD